jgi:hypothetical protein
MKQVHFYQTHKGWIYVVWVGERPTVVGCAATRHRAEQEAQLA